MERALPWHMQLLVGGLHQDAIRDYIYERGYKGPRLLSNSVLACTWIFFFHCCRRGGGVNRSSQAVVGRTALTDGARMELPLSTLGTILTAARFPDLFTLGQRNRRVVNPLLTARLLH